MTGHPNDDYNGIYRWVDDWNEKPNFVNAHDKHIYYYNKKYGGDYGWNLDGRDQAWRANPGELAWNEGGYVPCDGPEVCDAK